MHLHIEESNFALSFWAEGLILFPLESSLRPAGMLLFKITSVNLPNLR